MSIKQVLILSAGLGSRFVKRGVLNPKTLLPVDGRPVIEHNLTAFLDAGAHVTVVASMQVAAHVRGLRLPGVTVVDCPVVQRGPVMSAMLASAHMEPDYSTMIFDGDLIYSPSVIPDLLAPFPTGRLSRLVASDAGPNPQWCSVDYDPEYLTVRLKERDGSSHAKCVIAGGYGFSSWDVFLFGASYAVHKSLTYKTEPKMSQVIVSTQSVDLVKIGKHEWSSVGTPEEYEEVTKAAAKQTFLDSLPILGTPGSGLGSKP